jgi:hypothetical protein
MGDNNNNNNAAPAAAALAVMLDKVSRSLEHGVGAVKKNSMALAKQVSMRFSQAADLTSGKCMLIEAEDSENLEIPQEHKLLFDNWRKHKPETYAYLAGVANRFIKLTEAQQQFDFLAKEAPGMLAAIKK